MSTPRTWREIAAGYDVGANGYDERHASVADVARHRAIDAPMISATVGAARVLELGVGTGRLLAQVGASFRAGVDIAMGMLGQARRKGLTVVQADAHHLPFAAETFGAIVAGGAVFRYLDTATALAECVRVIHPGGRIAVHQLGARTWGIRGPREPDRRVHELFTVADLLGPARQVGLSIQKIVRWRTIRVPPFIVEIPAWMDRIRDLQLWNHVVVVMQRP